MKRPATDWKKIFWNHVSDKEPVSRKWKELLQLNNKKYQTTQMENGQKTRRDISFKRIYRQQISTLKYVDIISN